MLQLKKNIANGVNNGINIYFIWMLYFAFIETPQKRKLFIAGHFKVL